MTACLSENVADKFSLDLIEFENWKQSKGLILGVLEGATHFQRFLMCSPIKSEETVP